VEGGVCYNLCMSEMPKPADQPAPEAEFDAQDAALRALLSGIRGHDDADLAALYDATARRLYALAMRITHEAAGAEEVLGDVYLQVWQQAGRYDPARGKVMPWLCTICRSRALDYLRRREQHAGSDELAGHLEAAESNEGDPLDALAGLERGSLLRAELQKLDATQRQLLALAFFRDMSHQEIAKHTGMPLGTVKTVLRRSIQQLRRRFGDI